MTEIKKPGRPPKEEERFPLRVITFRVDQETFEALERLEKKIDVEEGSVGKKRKRSVLIRKLILDADRLEGK